MQLLLYQDEEFDPNFHYHAGLDIDHSFFLSSNGKRTLFVSKMNEALARSAFRGKVVVFDDAAKTLSKRLRGKIVLFDANSLNARMFSRLSRICRLKDDSVELLRLRSVKKPEEVSAIRNAVRHTKDILDSLDFGKAKTERGLRTQLLVAAAEAGLEPAFEPVISTGGNTAFPHHDASERKLGPLVMVDYGVRYRHYCADLTRCFIRDGDAKKKSQYEQLQGICHAIVDGLPDLRRGKDVAAFSARLIERAGFPRLFIL
jgi:Xaa-Pro aminopeptidase